MTLTEYTAALKRKQTGGYLFYGDEPYLAARYLDMTRKAYFEDADLAAFNHIRLEGEQFSPQALLDAIQSLPVFAEHKLIEISQISPDEMSEQERTQLCEVLACLPEYEYNTLIFTAAPDELDPGTPKKPSPVLKALSEVLCPVLFERQTPAKLNKWLGQHFAAWEVLAPPQVCTFLIQYCGTDMYALAAQAEKCACYVLSHGRSELSEQDVRAVASPVTEYDAFALGDAILSGHTDLALAILSDRLRRRERPELILSGIASVFQTLLRIRVLLGSGLSLKDIAAKTGLHAYRVELFARSMGRRTEDSLRHALALCSEADWKMKTTALDPTVILERLVVAEGEDRGRMKNGA